MNGRKLEALRNLAERPGTEAEGELARELLKRWEAKIEAPLDEGPAWALFTDLLKNEVTTEDFLEKLRRRIIYERAQPLPNHWECACGAQLAIGDKCNEQLAHLLIQQAIREKFSPGDRVVYNYHAYPDNCPGRVAAYVKLKQSNGNYPWAWISVKFDHLKQARQIPIYSAKGWHLSKAPALTSENPLTDKQEAHG